MTNEIEKYKKAIEQALEHSKIYAFDDPYLWSSDMSDVYRLVQYHGEPSFLHKSRGSSWYFTPKLTGVRMFTWFDKDHRNIFSTNK